MSELAVWLDGLGLGRYAEVFANNDIGIDVLPELSDEHLKELGVSLGHRVRLLKAIAALSLQAPQDPPSREEPAMTRAPRSSAPERRQLTVMFVDLVGSTALSGRLDPEDMRKLILDYQNVVAGEISRFEGYIARFMGDGVLVYFGWPQAHEDDAERAVRASLAVTAAVAKLRTPSGAALATRTGIATGLVVVGDLIGEGTAQEQVAAVGETPNLAARLQGLAAPDAVVVSDSTRRLLGGVFELQKLSPRTLKGITGPVAAFIVVRERPSESRFEAHQGDSTLALVGRDEELALLLRRWQQAGRGNGQAVLISGEAGIGKSRLLRALDDALEGQPRYRINYQGSPYHTDSALYPAIQQLMRAAEFAASDSDETRLDKLEALLGVARVARADSAGTAALIAALLDIDTEQRYGNLDLTPQQQRAQTLQALIVRLTGLAQRQPVLLVVEDAHWVDPTTLELVELTLEAISEARVLLLLIARPTFEHRLASHPIVTRLVLNRLGRESTMGIINRLTGGKALPDDMLDAITGRTDGVPLFVEELTKTVLEAGLLRENGEGYLLDGALPSLAIPSSLQDSLMARLDRLSAAKEVAQTGACIGREFDHALLAAVSPLEETKIEAALAALTDSELVFRRGEPPESTYVFKHALVRDAAYESLLKSRRAWLHSRIAERLSKLRPEQAANEPELLAHHYTAAGLTEEAVRRWVDAARRATQRSAYSEALAQLDRAVELLSALPRAVEWTRCALDIQTLRAGALVATRGFVVPETVDAYEQARALCKKLNDPPEVYAVLRGLYNATQTQGNLPTALAVANECLQLAEAQGDSAPLSLGHRLVGQCSLVMMGELVQARVHLEQALSLYEPMRHRESAAIYGVDLRTGAGQVLCASLCLLGYPDQGLAMAQDVHRHARQLGHPFSLTNALDFVFFVHVLRGEYNTAYGIAKEQQRLAIEYGFEECVDFAGTQCGIALALQGLSDRVAIAQLERDLRAHYDSYSDMFVPYTFALLAGPAAVSGSLAEGLDVMEHAMAMGRARGENWYDAELHRLQAELLRMGNGTKPNGAAAERSLEQALEIARRQQAKWLELRAATSLARLWQQHGKTAQARDLVTGVYHWFTEGFDTQDLREAKALLEQLA